MKAVSLGLFFLTAASLLAREEVISGSLSPDKRYRVVVAESEGRISYHVRDTPDGKTLLSLISSYQPASGSDEWGFRQSLSAIIKWRQDSGCVAIDEANHRGIGTVLIACRAQKEFRQVAVSSEDLMRMSKQPWERGRLFFGEWGAGDTIVVRLIGLVQHVPDESRDELDVPFTLDLANNGKIIAISPSSFAASTTIAGLPAQDDVFTIAIFTPPSMNYVSADYIFSALPFYEGVRPGESHSGYPSHKKADAQRGAIVLRDKTVLLFDTRSPNYLSVVEPSNHYTFYRLPNKPAARRKCPRPPSDINALPFPKPEDVFCVATYSWNQGKHFTPQSLVEALPRFRPLTAQDIPGKAIWTSSNTGRFPFPKEWVEAQRELDPQPLNGVLVLNNRAVLKWITWTPHAIAFENYRNTTYFVIDE